MKSINKLVYGISLLTTVGIFSSCAKDSDNNFGAKAAQARPQQLSFTQPAPGAPLTKAQANEIKAVFGQKPAISIPPTELLFKDEDAKLDHDQLRSLRYSENQLQYTANAETYALYKSLRSSCRKQHGTLNLDATVPLEKVTSIDDLKTGDHFNTTAVASYGGLSCDVDSEGKITYAAKVDKLETDGVASGEVSYSLKALMKNPKYAELLKSKGIVASSSVTGLVAKQNVHTKDPSDAEASVKFSIVGSYFTLTQEIPVDSAYKVYAKGIDAISAEVQTEMVVQIKMPTFTARIDSQIIAITYKDGMKPAQVKHEKFYINGNEMTSREIADLFGDNLNSQAAKNVTETFTN